MAAYDGIGNHDDYFGSGGGADKIEPNEETGKEFNVFLVVGAPPRPQQAK